MFHTLKSICTRYYRRIRGLIRYIFDFKILYFSLLYIFTTLIFQHLLRNISRELVIGLIITLVSSLSLFLLLFMLLRNIETEQKEEIGQKNAVQQSMYNIKAVLFTLLLVIISLVRTKQVLSKELETEKIVPSFTNQPVSFEGYIDKEPEKKQSSLHLSVTMLQDIHIEGATLSKSHGHILVKGENYEELKVGQVCNFKGILEEPENFDDFDYKSYLNSREIFLIMGDPTYSCFSISSRRAGSLIKSNLVDFKDNMIEIVDRVLHEPYSSLLVGILFGKKRLFTPEFDSSIRIAGVSHVISASGYNITIILLILNRVLLFVPKKVKIILSLVVVWLYGIFSGLTSSIIRACIMNTLSLIALFWGRSNSTHISLPLTSAIFVFLKPKIILDVGFLLSISAMLGIVYILPILTSIKKFKFAKESIFPTMSCTLSTLPLSIITFETFSIWPIFINTIILPVVGNSMLWGTLSILLFKIYTPLSYFFFSVVYLQLRFFEYIVGGIGRIGWGGWDIVGRQGMIIAITILLSLLLSVIYYYPLENEKYNYYLKDR